MLRYHPVDASTVPWDWELMKSVMKEQVDTFGTFKEFHFKEYKKYYEVMLLFFQHSTLHYSCLKDDTRRLRTEVQYLLLQYVLQVLEDDFHFKLRSQCLHHSVAKKMLSCGNETIGQVK